MGFCLAAGYQALDAYKKIVNDFNTLTACYTILTPGVMDFLQLLQYPYSITPYIIYNKSISIVGSIEGYVGGYVL